MVGICISLHSLFIAFRITNMVTCILESILESKKKQKHSYAQSHRPDVPSADVSCFFFGLYYLFF